MRGETVLTRYHKSGDFSASPADTDCARGTLTVRWGWREEKNKEIQDALRQLELTTLPHLAYSPDLAHSDYYLFPQLKKYLKDNHYHNNEEVIADVRRWSRG
ncbi:histone-lysine N-methyltransferase SETMAR [Elysia marginata]|uniref:Histone-lysine N-methyltransferase SETMAR n=1 Tax=Elysia marginata TaxID=1093978 RepID=A0AAV4IKC5_9GAST|nr:histone-lysine N-methyltransferase SETMAR [Elysia marginata]